MTPLLAAKAVLKAILLPPMLLVWVAAIALLFTWRGQKVPLRLATICLGALIVLSTPNIAVLLVHALGNPPPFLPQDARDCGAIVILSGGIRRHAPEYGADTLSALTLERVRYGARVARITGLPVLVSGGHPQGGEAEAAVMRTVLESELGVPVRWVEADSDNTHENAANSARILRDVGITRIVLVTHAFDVRRATAEFEAFGMHVVPAATNLPSHAPATWLDWVPSMSGLQLSYYAFYEIGGNVVRVLATPFREKHTNSVRLSVQPS